MPTESNQINGNGEKFLLTQIQKKYGVNREGILKRMRYLQISAWKEQGGNKLYLDVEQVRYLDELHVYMQENHDQMAGYPVPSPSGLVTSITSSDAQNALITEESAIDADEQIDAEEVTDLRSSIHAAGMSKAIGIMIAENEIASQYLKNPELLPQEWREKIAASLNPPKIDPFAFAASLKSSLQLNAAEFLDG